MRTADVSAGHERLLAARFMSEGERLDCRTPSLAACRLVLEAAAVDYEVVAHPATFRAEDEAIVVGVSPSAATKTVVLHDHGTPLLAVIPASARLDLAYLRRLRHAHRSLRLASEAEIAEDFGDFAVGAVPPFAAPGRVVEVLDVRLLAPRQVLCPAGDRWHGILIDPADLVRVVEPQVADICQAG